MTDPSRLPGPNPHWGYWEWDSESGRWDMEDFRRKRRQAATLAVLSGRSGVQLAVLSGRSGVQLAPLANKVLSGRSGVQLAVLSGRSGPVYWEWDSERGALGHGGLQAQTKAGCGARRPVR